MARFQVPLLCYLQRFLSREDAEDVLQETFLKGYRSIEKYDPAWTFSTWIFTIAHRQAVSSGRKKTLKLVNQFNVAQDLPAQVDGPFDAAVQSEARDSLWAKAGEILEPDALTALWLTYVNGMTAGEVGVVLDRSANAVRLMLSRSRAQLAEKLPFDWKIENKR